MEDFLLTIKATAKILGVSTGTLRNWDKSGALKPVRTIGKHRRYRMSDIKKYMEVNG